MTEMDDRTAQQGDSNVFDLTRRGYDRRQVDDHVHSLLVQLAETEQARQREEARANRAEAELGHAHERLRAQIAAGDTQRLAIVPQPDQDGRADVEADDSDGVGSWSHAGFGMRLEKLLRAAEQEAALTRQSANREAHALLEQARADAEVHRHEMEQTLVARTTEIDQKAARRKVELDERERGINEQGAVAQQESDQLIAEARRRAEEIETQARDEVDDLVARVQHDLADREAASKAELKRLERMRHGVRGDLGRLMQSLAGEFDRRGITDGTARGDDSHADDLDDQDRDDQDREDDDQDARPGTRAEGPQRATRESAPTSSSMRTAPGRVRASGSRQVTDAAAHETVSLDPEPADGRAHDGGHSASRSTTRSTSRSVFDGGYDHPSATDARAQDDPPASYQYSYVGSFSGHSAYAEHSEVSGTGEPVDADLDANDDEDDDVLYDDGEAESGTLALGNVTPPSWFGRSRSAGDGPTRPPPGPGHLRRTGHGGHGRTESDDSRSRWFEGSAGRGGTGADGVVDAAHEDSGHDGHDGHDEYDADDARHAVDEPERGAESSQPVLPQIGARYRAATGPAGLPGPVSPVGSMSLAGPIERFSLSAPVGGMGPLGPMPGR